MQQEGYDIPDIMAELNLSQRRVYDLVKKVKTIATEVLKTRKGGAGAYRSGPVIPTVPVHNKTITCEPSPGARRQSTA